jgi:MoaA/NifB/PqqE/SkfB family radical SAM enzyme
VDPEVVRLLQIEPTTRCNFTCGFCVGRHLDQNDISLETVRHALERFPRLERLELHGEGEPLLHPDYFEMARLARERGIKISTITNGSMFSAERIEKILDSGIDTLFVSIESPRAEDFKDIRGGSLHKVVAGIKALLAARDARGQVSPTVGFGVTVLRRTQHLMPEIARLYKELGMDGGISAHMLNTMPNYTDYYNAAMADQVLSPMEQGLAWARYAKVIEAPEYQRSTAAVHFSDEVFGQIDSKRGNGPAKTRFARDYRSCPWLDKGLYINRHGNASGCARIKDTERFGFGNLRRDPLEMILENRARLGDEVNAGMIPQACAGCFIAENIAARIGKLAGKMPEAIVALVSESDWDSAANGEIIGHISYDGEAVQAMLGYSDGTRVTGDIIARCAADWKVAEERAARRILPILNELLRLRAIRIP